MPKFKQPGKGISRLSDRVGGGSLPVNIGEPFEGGYLFGVATFSGVLYALIASPKASGDSGSGRQWKNALTTSAGSQSITDGEMNTAAIDNVNHPAAQFCTGLSIGGHSDWYMPSLAELATLYGASATLPAGEALNATRYWSSTENAASTSLVFWVTNNVVEFATKTDSRPVRAIRRHALS